MSGAKGRRWGANVYVDTAIAVGSLFYVDSNHVLQPIAPGTSGDVLTSNGAGATPNYQTPSGGGGGGTSGKLADVSGTGVSSLDVMTRTGGGAIFQSDYPIYEIHLIVTPATNGQDIQLLFSSAATFLTSGYEYILYNNSTGSAGYGVNASPSAAAIQLFPTPANTPWPLTARITLSDPLGTTLKKNCELDVTAVYQPNGARYSQRGSAFVGTTAALDGIRIKAASGITGRVLVYGR